MKKESSVIINGSSYDDNHGSRMRKQSRQTMLEAMQQQTTTQQVMQQQTTAQQVMQQQRRQQVLRQQPQILKMSHGPVQLQYGVHRKIRTQAGLQKSVMHLMQLIQTGISLSIMVYVQRVMQKQRLHRMLKTPQMYIC